MLEATIAIHGIACCYAYTPLNSLYYVSNLYELRGDAVEGEIVNKQFQNGNEAVEYSWNNCCNLC